MKSYLSRHKQENLLAPVLSKRSVRHIVPRVIIISTFIPSLFTHHLCLRMVPRRVQCDVTRPFQVPDFRDPPVQ